MAFGKIKRRHLLLAAGGVVATAGAGGLWLAVWKARQRRWAKPATREQTFAPSVYLAIGEDSRTTIWLTKTEMGQGVMTALPMLIAEELGCEWGTVEVLLADLETTHDYGNMFTAASSSTSSLWEELRKAGAAAREMLVSAAAATFGVSESACVAEASHVRLKGSDKSLSFGELAPKAARLHAPLRPRLKQPGEFQLIGQRIPRVDARIKVTGEAKYGIDTRVEGAAWVALLRCPVRGGSLLAVDVKPALSVEGVTDVIKLDFGVAVAGSSTFAVQEGLRFLDPKWKLPAHRPGSEKLDQALRAELERAGQLIDEKGEPEGGDSEHSLDQSYFAPFLAHAPMEPLNCTVDLRKDRCEIWASTQNPAQVLSAALRITGLTEEQILIHRTLVGGGFGRRTHTDDVEEALQIALKLKRPVHLVWSREDEIQHGIYREAVAHRLMGKFAKDGGNQRLIHRVVSATGTDPAQVTKGADIPLMGATDLPYSMKGSRVEWRGLQSPVRVGIWRSVGYSHNTFAIESYIDEVAHAVKRDPVELRLDLLQGNPRLRACLERVRKMASWEEKRAEDVALGVAVCSCFGSHVAQIAEVRRAEQGRPRVTRVWCAVDCGLPIHPDTIEAQVEGGIVFGLTAALYGRITVGEGAVRESNFHDYPLLRQAEMPEVLVAIIPSAAPPSGMGELAVPPIAPAVANAWFRLTGERNRTLPFKESSS